MANSAAGVIGLGARDIKLLPLQSPLVEFTGRHMEQERVIGGMGIHPDDREDA